MKTASGIHAIGAHARRDVLRIAAASAVGLALSGRPSVAAGGGGAKSGPLKSAGALTFGPDNVLFVGDITGAAVHAFALRPTDVASQADVELGNFHNFEGRDLVRGLDQKLAALFGTTYDKIVVNDMVVHQPSQQVFISVERGRSTDASPAIVKINHGRLEVLELDRIPHSQVGIPNEPDPKAMLEFDTQRSFAITDVKYHNGEIFVTGVSNQRFASTLHRIPYPFKAQMETCTVEIWHPVHGSGVVLHIETDVVEDASAGRRLRRLGLSRSCGAYPKRSWTPGRSTTDALLRVPVLPPKVLAYQA